MFVSCLLGGLQNKGVLNQSADNIKTSSAYRLSGNGISLGCPENYGILSVVCGDTLVDQYFRTSSKLWVRRFSNNAWESWIMTPLTESVNDLASLLGGILGFTWKPGNYDGYINSIKPGFVYYKSKSDDSGLPTTITPGMWIWVMTFGRGDGLQIAVSNGSSIFNIRFGYDITGDSPSWNAWRTLETSVI